MDDTARRAALIRGVNVGGRRGLPMADLRAAAESAGCTGVETYLQSGILLVAAPGLADDALERLLEEAIAARCGVEAAVLVRDAAAIEAILRGCPFPDPGSAPAAHHVVFLREAPDPARAAALDPARSPGDAFRVAGREVYLRCPDGIGRSRLTLDWFERGLATPATGRNWRTVMALAERTAA